MSSTKRTVVVEMSDDLYRELAQVATNGDMTLAELLIGHTCAVELNARAADGDLGGWKVLAQAWRQTDPRHVPEVDVEELFVQS